MSTEITETEPSIEPFVTDWNGYTVSIDYEPDWLSFSKRGEDVAHFDIETLDPPRAPLPITDTGYRSVFTCPRTVKACGGPVAFVLAMLDQAAESQEWQDRELAARQLCLF